MRTALAVGAIALVLGGCSSKSATPSPAQVGANDAAVCASIARGDANVPDATLKGASLALRQSIGSKDMAMVSTICQAEGVSIPTPSSAAIPTPTTAVATTRATVAPTAAVTTSTPVATTTAVATTTGHPAGATALCNDGTYSYSATHQGSCSTHKGVAQFYD